MHGHGGETMRLSTKISITSFAVGVIFSIIEASLAPTAEEFLRMEFSEAASRTQTLNALGSIAWIGIIVGIISLIVTAYKRIMDKETPRKTTIIHAGKGAAVAIDSGRAAVAKDGGRIDQSITVSDDRTSLSTEHLQALSIIADHIDASALPEERKRYAALLLDKVQTSETDSSTNSKEIRKYLGEILRLAESTRPTARAILDGVSLVKSLLQNS